MTEEQIRQLLNDGRFPDSCTRPALVETHISWVLLCDSFVYKIKKAVRYPFLDFSTLSKRKFYCGQELLLNRRLTNDIYLDVLPVVEENGMFVIDGNSERIVDYAVRMRKLEAQRRMDLLLNKDLVTVGDIEILAKQIAMFHKTATIIREKDFMDVQTKFNALAGEVDFVNEQIGREAAGIVDRAIHWSDVFLNKNSALLQERLHSGWFRDVHGDLHTRNIFLVAEPAIFDCIEFSDVYRQIDLLNEVAFLCMDLEAYGKKLLAIRFMEAYLEQMALRLSPKEQRLFIYYKAYRANVLALVGCLKARQSVNQGARQDILSETERYLALLDSYIKELS